MKRKEITLYNPQTGEEQNIRIGYSFTMFFFGFFVPFFRKDWQTGFILMLCDIFTLGIASIIFAGFYNAYFSKKLIKKGYKIKN